MPSEKLSHEPLSSPDFALAGSLQATLNNLDKRDFSLDIQQQEALEAIGQALVEGVNSGYIEMATSTGKTTVEALLAEAAVRAGKRVLLLAPTIPIARQIIGTNDEKPTGLARFAHMPDNTSVRSHFGPSVGNRTADIVVSTYAGLLNDTKRDHHKLGEFDVVIADECHRSLGEQTSQAMREVFPGAFKLGLSATPDYSVDRTSQEVFERSLYDFSLINAVESGKTAPVRTLIYETNETLRLSDQRKEFTDRELAPLIENMQRNNTALELSQAFVQEGRQGIIACVPGQANLHARLMADLLKSNGVKAVAVGSHLSAEEQALKLKLYEAGVFDVLTFTKSLEEGWDSDKASFAINLAPTTSPVRTKQLLGRILRKKTSDLDSVYVDFIDEKSGLAKSQYTAMHALDLDYIDFTRVLGRGSQTRSEYTQKPGLLHALSPKLLEQLRRSQGKLLQDISVGKPVDPLVKQWEATLAEEGLPEELSDNLVLPPRLQKRVKRAYAQFIRDNQVEPTPDDLIDLMGKLSNPERLALGKFALRADMTPFDEWNLEDTPATDDLSDQTEIAESNDFTKTLNWVLDTISERENKVIAMRMGLTTGDPMTLREIGTELGLDRERIRQIESKSLSKLRHPSRSKKLEVYSDTASENGMERSRDIYAEQKGPLTGVNLFKAKVFAEVISTCNKAIDWSDLSLASSDKIISKYHDTIRDALLLAIDDYNADHSVARDILIPFFKAVSSNSEAYRGYYFHRDYKTVYQAIVSILSEF